jgi:hypothetical protein
MAEQESGINRAKATSPTPAKPAGFHSRRNEIVPFAIHGNRSFTRSSVDKNVPAASGVYGLSNANQWIYVGESANMHAELFKHLQHPNTFLSGHSASGFTYELSSEEHRVQRRNQLVVELEPIGNRLGDGLSNWS